MAAALAALALLASVLSTAAASVERWNAVGVGFAADPLVAAEDAHLVVSEVQTGGAGASDEFIEIYNPSPFALPLEGLEVVYVSASGLSVTRKAAWEAGNPPLNPGAHLLIANEAGIYASLADVPYANGLAATGGSVAIRIVGASTAVDAVGWGSAASTWLEGTPIQAPPAGASIERLPGGASGSGQDTDHNVVDFVVRDLPDPQNLGSSPIPVGSPEPTPSGTANPSVAPSATPSASRCRRPRRPHWLCQAPRPRPPQPSRSRRPARWRTVRPWWSRRSH
ncbi:MAG TPA: lamin tail domain-containing protein [Candidatus Limnocylindria bacterium]|nr:lamin tail domain-containing protein [Candidatus Limnocylindria bacterium]